MRNLDRTSPIFTFACPYDGARLVWEITPEQVDTGPLLSVPRAPCPCCHRDVRLELMQAINAPSFLAKHVLDAGGIAVQGRPLPPDPPRMDAAGFGDFLAHWWAVREIIEGAEYLSEEERRLVQDRYGYWNGQVLSYQNLAPRYARSARTVMDLLHRVFEKVRTHSAPILLALLGASEAGTDASPVLLTVVEAAAMLDVTRSRVYQIGRFDRVADPIAEAPKGGWLVFACPLDQRPKGRRAKESTHGTFFVTRDSAERYLGANRPPGPKGVNTRAWRQALQRRPRTR